MNFAYRKSGLCENTKNEKTWKVNMKNLKTLFVNAREACEVS